MKKKVLALLMGTAMVVSLLAGCGNGNDGTDDTPDTSETGKQEEAKDTKDEAPAGGDEAPVKVVLITMDSLDQHWVTVDDGAQKAVSELNNVEYKWMAPSVKDDAEQIEQVNNALADGADAIVIAANGPTAITAALEEAKAEGVKIIYVDSPADTDAEATFSTDNEAAGETAGNEMLKKLEADGVTSGKIGIIGVNAATDSTMKREAGFRAAFEGSDFELLETQYGDGDAAKSQDIAENYLTEGCVGIFGVNEGSTVGAGNAIKGSGEDVIGVGFDQSDSIMSLIGDGSLLCTMAQNPDVMGYKGVMAAVKAARGETLAETDVDTGVSVLTIDDVE